MTLYPHIPVLLTAMVTSPVLSVSPFSSDSRLGSAGAIQRSWAGLVYTPMLALDGFTNVVVVEDMPDNWGFWLTGEKFARI